MLTYKDILFAITNKLSDNFNIDIIVDDTEGIFDNECFYATIVPSLSVASTRTTNKKDLIISVKYFGGDKLKCYDLANDLENVFIRSIKVNDRFLNISNTEPNIYKDEVGSVLDFLIYVTYFDDIYTEEERYENMSDINVDYINDIEIK